MGEPGTPHLLGVDVYLVATFFAAVATFAVLVAIYAATTVRDPMAKRVKAGRRLRLTITVRPAVKGAVVRVGKRRARTNAKGVARLRVRFAHRGRVRVIVRSGGRTGRTFLRVSR